MEENTMDTEPIIKHDQRNVEDWADHREWRVLFERTGIRITELRDVGIIIDEPTNRVTEIHYSYPYLAWEIGDDIDSHGVTKWRDAEKKGDWRAIASTLRLSLPPSTEEWH